MPEPSWLQFARTSSGPTTPPFKAVRARLREPAFPLRPAPSNRVCVCKLRLLLRARQPLAAKCACVFFGVDRQRAIVSPLALANATSSSHGARRTAVAAAAASPGLDLGPAAAAAHDHAQRVFCSRSRGNAAGRRSCARRRGGAEKAPRCWCVFGCRVLACSGRARAWKLLAALRAIASPLTHPCQHTQKKQHKTIKAPTWATSSPARTWPAPLTRSRRPAGR